jgi:hypothetical protein
MAAERGIPAGAADRRASRWRTCSASWTRSVFWRRIGAEFDAVDVDVGVSSASCRCQADHHGAGTGLERVGLRGLHRTGTDQAELVSMEFTDWREHEQACNCASD